MSGVGAAAAAGGRADLEAAFQQLQQDALLRPQPHRNPLGPFRNLGHARAAGVGRFARGRLRHAVDAQIFPLLYSFRLLDFGGKVLLALRTIS